MKWFLAFILILWTACGLLGAWWMDDHRLKVIARGPISLVKAYNDSPVDVPGLG